jgi:putative addiction module killer protein
MGGSAASPVWTKTIRDCQLFKPILDCEIADLEQNRPLEDMSQETWEIQKYVTRTGDCPFDNWFEDLDSQTQTRIDARFDRVSLGNFGDHKSVGEGVYELRFFFGSGYRVYYGLTERRIVLLLVGGSKKRQNRDIQIAQQLWAAYQSEQGGK